MEIAPNFVSRLPDLAMDLEDKHKTTHNAAMLITVVTTYGTFVRLK